MSEKVMTNAQVTKVLSKEFFVGLFIQFAVFVALGGVAYGSMQERIAGLEKGQVNAERIARLETQMSALQDSNKELKTSIDRLYLTLSRRQVDRDQ